MAERLNLAVDDGVGDLLTRLAGGERKRGQWLSDLVRGMADQVGQTSGSDFDALRLSHAGLIGQVRANQGQQLALEARLQALERAVAALMSRQ
jgi:hypothetical protein